MSMRSFLYCLFTLFALLVQSCIGGEIKIVNLRTEYLTEPIGIDSKAPRFTWEYAGGKECQPITSYQISIGTRKDDLRPYVEEFKFEPCTRYYWKVTAWIENDTKKIESDVASFETGMMSIKNWKGIWITDSYDKEYEPAPMFRKTFVINKKVKAARLYIASGGYHEIFLNQNRVGNHYLDPGYTQFDKRCLYVSHDVTSYVKKGTNVVCMVLGNGWYNEQSVAVWGFHEAKWRSRPCVLANLILTYDDDATDVISTDQSWLTSTGHYLYNSLYSGDVYDARMEEDGWKSANFDDGHWSHARQTTAPTDNIVSQAMPPIRIVDEVCPQSVKKINDSIYVYSFHKNMSGFCRLKIKGKRGTKISLSYGELLKSDGRLEQGNVNVYYHPVKPYEKFQTDTYILKGEGVEVFQPSFTYHGFQYVEVEASEKVDLDKSSLTALFLHTDLQPVGKFECSSPLLNKIWDATMQTYLSNIHSIPTDCPQREKNGWTADAHIAIDLALLGFDGITFYEKWMNDVLDNQHPDGDFSGIIPSNGWGYGKWYGPVWDAALFVIPEALYKYYGDTRCIQNLYPTMKRYLDYLKRSETADGCIDFGLGDWVYWKSITNVEFVSTAYYYRDCVLMAQFSDLIGQESKTFRLKADSLKALLNEKYYNQATGFYAEGTQTAQALALYFDLPDKNEKLRVAENLHKLVMSNNYFLDCGLIGTKVVLPMLVKYGYMSDAMKILMQTDAPSWGYWVEKMGYTTLPETWTLSPEFKDASLNHVFMGDVSAWMMKTLAGINPDEAEPGFAEFVLTPHFVKELDWVKGSYHSVKGLISCQWKRIGDRIECEVQVPVGVKAVLQLKNERKQVCPGKHRFEISDNVTE